MSGSLALSSLKTAYLRTAALFLSLPLGALVPQAHGAIWVVRWLIMAMLFLVFLQTRFTRHTLHRSHVLILIANIAIGFAAWGLGYLIGGRSVALALFFTGITPTATAAPVIVGFLKGRVDYAVAAFLLTNLVITALMPLFLPVVLGEVTGAAFVNVLLTVCLVVGGPMLLAWIVRRIHPNASLWSSKLSNVSFSLWVIALFLIMANASYFLHSHPELHGGVVALIAVCTAAVCVLNFALGRLLGGVDFPREASQCLGQKNTTFTIFMAVTYANPLVALGPTFYVIWHNVWNSWQLHRMQVSKSGESR